MLHRGACTSTSSATTPTGVRVLDHTVRYSPTLFPNYWLFPSPAPEFTARAFPLLHASGRTRSLAIPNPIIPDLSTLLETSMLIPSLFRRNSQPLLQNPRRSLRRRAPRRRPRQLQDRRPGQLQGLHHRQARPAHRAEQRSRGTYIFPSLPCERRDALHPPISPVLVDARGGATLTPRGS